MNRRFFAIPLLALLVAAAAFLSSAKTLKAPFLLDDYYKIVHNNDIRGTAREVISRLVYPYDPARRIDTRNDPSRPLVQASFALNYRLGGLDAAGYHLVSLLLHAANTVLVFLFLRFVFARVFGVGGLSLPFFAALLFGVHPVNSYTVSYIFCRSDLLAVFFSLGAVCSWLCLPRKWQWSVFACLCFIAALFSKQSAIVLPGLIMLTDIARAEGPDWKGVRGFLRAYAGFMLIALGYLAWRWYFLGGMGDQEAPHPWDRYQYLMLQPYAAARYVQYLAVPIGLCFFHAMPPAAFLSARVIYPLLGWAAAFMAVAALVWRFPASRRGVAWCVGWFLLALLPTSSIFPTTNIIVDNRLYFSGIGLISALSLGYGWVYRRAAGRPIFKILVVAIMVFHVVFFFMLTRLRSTLYVEPVLLWSDVIERYPESSIAYIERGLIFSKAGMSDRAIADLAKAGQLAPNNAYVWLNLGAINAQRGEFKNAAAVTRMAVSLIPRLVPGHVQLGDIYQHLGDDKAALRSYEQALLYDPRAVQAMTGIGEILMRRGEHAAADAIFERALAIAPDMARARARSEKLRRLMGPAKE